MSTKQQLRINYIPQISTKSDVKKIKHYHTSKNNCKLSANSLAMIKKHEIRINYIVECSIKSDAKKNEILSHIKKIIGSFRLIL